MTAWPAVMRANITPVAATHGNVSVHMCRNVLGLLREIEMTSQEPSKDEEKGRVLPFRPRAPRSWNAKLRLRDQPRPPVDDLSKYSRGPEEDNYRQRMVMNLLAFLVLALIVYCGIWLANTMSQLRKDQDCALSGRTNCAPIRVPGDPR
jgi:hypothetical protein